MRWSVPVLKLIMTEMSVKMRGLSVRMKLISFFRGGGVSYPYMSSACWVSS